MKSEKAPDIKGPCLILANHTMDVDPILLTRSFPKHFYFLASEHIFSWGWKSRIIEWVAGPVSKMKGTADTGAVKEVIRRIKKGHSICIFPEGNRSFTGITKPIIPATGKLVKACGATLVTYRFEGGYFSSPRWAYKGRRGKMKGYVVGVYPYKEIERLSSQEINELIQRDLKEDAYLRQQKDPIPFRGKNLAEWLELSLYICPLCETIGSLKSEGSNFFCNNCELCSTIDEYGWLHSSTIPFHTVIEWDNWQKEKLREISLDARNEMVFFDQEQTLFMIAPSSHQRRELASGTLAMYKNRFILDDKVFFFQDILDLNVHGKQTLVFSYQGISYEIKSKLPRSARKYVTFYQHITGNGDIDQI